MRPSMNRVVLLPMITTLSGAQALARAIRAQREGEVHVLSLQERLPAPGRAAGPAARAPHRAHV